jgi:hypothetical protein
MPWVGLLRCGRLALLASVPIASGRRAPALALWGAKGTGGSAEGTHGIHPELEIQSSISGLKTNISQAR